MLYIKSFRLFESGIVTSQWIEPNGKNYLDYKEIDKYLKDMFLELKDYGFDVNLLIGISKKKNMVNVTITKPHDSDEDILREFKMSDILDTLQVVNSYLVDIGFKLDNMSARTSETEKDNSGRTIKNYLLRDYELDVFDEIENYKDELDVNCITVYIKFRQ